VPLTDKDRKRGGKSSSPAKKKASAANGKLGGRKRGTVKRTLGEFLMRQKLGKSDLAWVHAGILHLSKEGGRGERHQFERFFGVKVGGGLPLPGIPHWTTTITYKQKHAARGTPMNRIIRKFRSAARRAKKAGY